MKSPGFVVTYRSGCIQNFEHALLSIDFDLLPVAVLDGWIVFFYENPLYKLYCERRFADTSTTKYDNFIFTHFVYFVFSNWSLWFSFEMELNMDYDSGVLAATTITSICCSQIVWRADLSVFPLPLYTRLVLRIGRLVTHTMESVSKTIHTPSMAECSKFYERRITVDFFYPVQVEICQEKKYAMR